MQAGAVSCTEPVQVSPALPLGWSVVTLAPLNWQLTATAAPLPGPQAPALRMHGTWFVTWRLMTWLSGSMFWTAKVH